MATIDDYPTDQEDWIFHKTGGNGASYPFNAEGNIILTPADESGRHDDFLIACKKDDGTFELAMRIEAIPSAKPKVTIYDDLVVLGDIDMSGSFTGGITADDSNLLQGNNSAHHLARGNHTGTQALATVTGHDKAAHDALGIAAATATNADDSALLQGNNSAFHLSRVNHTGTQAISTLSDHDKAAHDALGIDADTVDGKHASAFAPASAIIQLSSTSNTNLNQTTATPIDWDVDDIKDPGLTHSTATNPSRITFDSAGRYRVWVNIVYDTNDTTSDTNNRSNPRIRLRLNGTTILDGEGLSGYIREDAVHQSSGNQYQKMIEVSASDYLEIITDRGNSLGANTLTLRDNQSTLLVERVA